MKVWNVFEQVVGWVFGLHKCSIHYELNGIDDVKWTLHSRI